MASAIGAKHVGPEKAPSSRVLTMVSVSMDAIKANTRGMELARDAVFGKSKLCTRENSRTSESAGRNRFSSNNSARTPHCGDLVGGEGHSVNTRDRRWFALG